MTRRIRTRTHAERKWERQIANDATQATPWSACGATQFYTAKNRDPTDIMAWAPCNQKALQTVYTLLHLKQQINVAFERSGAAQRSPRVLSKTSSKWLNFLVW
jgi:hypothetical protein